MAKNQSGRQQSIHTDRQVTLKTDFKNLLTQRSLESFHRNWMGYNYRFSFLHVIFSLSVFPPMCLSVLMGVFSFTSLVCMLASHYCCYSSMGQPIRWKLPSAATLLFPYTHANTHMPLHKVRKEGSLTVNLWKMSSQRTKHKGTAVYLDWGNLVTNWVFIWCVCMCMWNLNLSNKDVLHHLHYTQRLIVWCINSLRTIYYLSCQLL